MAFSDVRSVNTRRRLLLCLFMVLVGAGQPVIATASDTARSEFQNILQETLEALWTGQEFSPELTLRQQTLQSMLASGDVKKAELESMMETTILSLLDRHQTSRYILKNFPERLKALFSPHMEWADAKKIIWRALSSVVKKDAPLMITIATLAPPGTPWLSVPETIAIPEIEKMTDGKILIKIYGGGVMGDDADILKKMTAGQLDGCGCTALGVLASSPEASALLLPGLFNNYEEADYICEQFRKRLDKAFEDKGYVVVALIDTGAFYLFSKNKVAGLADVKKQNVMTWIGVVETTLYQELGINATPVPVPEAVSALSTGLFDTYLAPAAWTLGMQAYQYTNYYLKPSLLYSPAAVFISTHTVDRLQKQAGVSAIYACNVREILVSEFNALEPEWKRQIRNYEEKSFKAFETKCGMKAMTFPPEDQQLIEKANSAVQQKLAGKVFPKDLMDDIQKALKEYRATH